MLQSMRTPALQKHLSPPTKLAPVPFKQHQLETIGGESITGGESHEGEVGGLSYGGPTSNDRLRMILYDLMSH